MSSWTSSRTLAIIHNAPFDIGFLDNELQLIGGQQGRIGEQWSVIDTWRWPAPSSA
jgi:DNA polymerase III epsilon subunit-like protein